MAIIRKRKLDHGRQAGGGFPDAPEPAPGIEDPEENGKEEELAERLTDSVLHEDGYSRRRPKRRKIRVELIKEPAQPAGIPPDNGPDPEGDAAAVEAPPAFGGATSRRSGEPAARGAQPRSRSAEQRPATVPPGGQRPHVGGAAPASGGATPASGGAAGAAVAPARHGWRAWRGRSRTPSRPGARPEPREAPDQRPVPHGHAGAAGPGHQAGGQPRERGRAEEAGADLRHPQGAHGPPGPDLRPRLPGDPAGRLRLPAFPQLQLPAGPGRHLHLPFADPAVQPEDRRHGVRPDPPAQGGGALLRHAARGERQLRRPRGRPDPHPLRQPHPAVPRQDDQPGDRGARRSPPG